jgi:hypothetical protein
VLLIGSGVAAATAPHGAPAAKAVAVSSASPSASVAPSPTPTNADREPLDPSTVTAADSAAAVAITDSTTTAGSAISVLATLPVRGRAPATGYDRTGQFGAAWLDVDHNGCDTRNDVLARDLAGIVRRGSCTVLSGTLNNPYTGRTIAFTRGVKTSALVQIDHIVPLLDAWETGAQQLTPAQRITLANDPLNLLAVDAHSNEQKSAGDAATWLPANTAFRCEYVARQISVKATYGLWVTRAEHDAMARVLGSCPDQAVESSAFTPKPAPAPAPAPAPDVYYANCAAVRAAGAAPLYRGQPGYAPKLDRDGDGIACE